METEFKEVWETITGIRRDVSGLEIRIARSEEREIAHVGTVERLMKEFRDHAGKEEMTLARVEKKLSEHDGGQKTLERIFGNWVPTLISLAALLWVVLSQKPH